MDVSDCKNRFLSEVINDGKDTKCVQLETLCNVLNSIHEDDLFKFSLVNPKLPVIQMLYGLGDGNLDDVMSDFDKLENAFYCLSQYAWNLCRDSETTDYRYLKTYTGYYTGNILSVMNGYDRKILGSMGYMISSESENEDIYMLKHVSNRIIDLAFELFLSQSFCRKLKVTVREALQNSFNIRAIMSVIHSYDIHYVIDTGIHALIEQFDKTGKHEDESVTRSPAVRFNNERLLDMEDSIDDDDLYAPESIAFESKGSKCRDLSNDMYGGNVSSEGAQEIKDTIGGLGAPGIHSNYLDDMKDLSWALQNVCVPTNNEISQFNTEDRLILNSFDERKPKAVESSECAEARLYSDVAANSSRSENYQRFSADVRIPPSKISSNDSFISSYLKKESYDSGMKREAEESLVHSLEMKRDAEEFSVSSETGSTSKNSLSGSHVNIPKLYTPVDYV